MNFLGALFYIINVLLAFIVLTSLVTIPGALYFYKDTNEKKYLTSFVVIVLVTLVLIMYFVFQYLISPTIEIG
jgi:hypothetical protein